ncbi:hypothetical protein [Pantoea phytobeneficialis]|uniref:Uncharacterized protein n=1 Tax=Pantoea phytobeneficialis TaxID=2052056 RepID=A0AAP9KRS7_9GAMM|nr:hypothetical protein [Pantoea phytobeneficialis]MDO6406854.1 hypothetical protein [Pantoea phytobeneficialis]QGR09374.1 hypothetical protein CTZ24_23315 [Pantoea phytobeneficialis]
MIPALVGAFIYTLILLFHSVSQFWADMMEKSYIEQRNWWINHASAGIRLAEHSSLFPVEDAALKMLRLEGEMPPLKDIPRKLSVGVDEDMGLSRTQQILTHLLDQLDIATLNRPEVWLYIRNADQPTQQDASAIIHNHTLLQKPTLHLLQALPQCSMLEEWIMTYFCDSRLLIIMELQGANDDAFCEYATALLFAHQCPSPDTRMPVWCFRSLNCHQHQVEKYLDILFAAKQVVPANLRHVWSGNLQGEALHLLKDAFNETLSGIPEHNWHRLPVAATWTPGYRWLMLEWAAQAIRHGQRGQLLATQQGEKQQINVAMMSGERINSPADDGNNWLQILHGIFKIITLISLIGLEILLIRFSLPKETQDDAFIYLFIMPAGMMLLALGIFTQGLNIARRHRERIIDYYRR